MRSLLAVSLFLALGGAVLFGCGGGDEGFSGVESGQRLRDLSAGDMRKVCVWVIERQGGEGAVHDCGNGLMVTLDSVDECVEDQAADFGACSLTVAELETCVIVVGEDPCLAPVTPECEPLGECYSDV
jgi:hypothetical protein